MCIHSVKRQVTAGDAAKESDGSLKKSKSNSIKKAPTFGNFDNW